MTQNANRRTFLKTLGALGAVAALPSFGAARGAESSLVPKKVDALSGKPVLTIAHCCDPQFGFGEGEDSYKVDVARFERELELVNAAKPDLVFFAGDMCNDRKRLRDEWPNLLKGVEAPFLTAAGNHDIPDPLKKADVDVFVEVFGAEYASKEVNGWKVIAFNSQYVRETEEEELYEKQVEWFKREIGDAKEKGISVILGSHVPPFVKTLEEKDEYFNFPTKIRQDFLDFAVDSGTRFYLAGHTHTTLERSYRDLPILNAETTSRNFDKRPFGFRLLKIDADMNYEWNFVGLD
ncbi:MAG: metallophosphoesterase [Thermoguttaceae bacterium]|nr:metallophosphoesterase [Thermoguttaceae bacterium]